MADLSFDTCMRCNEVFFRVASSVCLKCQPDEEEDYRKIRDVLARAPGLNVEQLAEASGIGSDCVLRMIEDERIVNVVSSDPVPCGRCGAPAISQVKRLCEKCLVKLENECSASIRELKEQISIEKRDNMYTVHEAVEMKRAKEKKKKKKKKKEPVPVPLAKNSQRMAIQERSDRKYGER